MPLLTGVYEYRHIRTTPVLAALVLAIGPLFGGLDNGYGNAVSCIANNILLIFLLAGSLPPVRFWGHIAPVVAIVVAAMAWGWIASTAPVSIAGLPQPLAYTPDLALSEILGLFAGLSALVAGCLIGFRSQRLAQIIDWILLCACPVVLLGLVFAQNDVGMMGGLWGVGKAGRFVGTLGNANVAAAYYAALATLAFARALDLGRDNEVGAAWAHWLAVLLCLGACAITASRAPMAAALMAMIAVAGFALRKSLRKRGIVAALVILAAVIATLFLTGYADLLLGRVSSLQSEGALRVMMWEHYYRLAQASPLFGYGLGSFSDVNRHFLGGVRFAQAMWTVNSPHNVLLQMSLNGGLPYLVLLSLASLWAVATIIWVRFRDGWDIVRIGIAAAIGVITACAMVDIALDVPAMVTILMFLAGLLWGDALSRTALVPVTRPQRAPSQ